MQGVKRTEVSFCSPAGSCAVSSPVVTGREAAPALTEQSNNPLSRVTEHHRVGGGITQRAVICYSSLIFELFSEDEFILSSLTQFWYNFLDKKQG